MQRSELPKSLSPIANLSLYASAALLFIQTSYIAEFLHAKVGKTHMLEIVAPVAILLALLSGGIAKAISHRAMWFWFAFLAWLIIGIPFSRWPGGSLNAVLPILKYTLPIMLCIAGAAFSYRHIRVYMNTLALSGAFMMVIAATSLQESGQRMFMWERGTISDPNDLASHLLFLVPFLAYVMLDSSQWMVFRIGMGVLVLYNLFTVLTTASRGGFIALIAGLVFVLIVSPVRIRILGLILALIVTVAAPLIVPDVSLSRLTDFVSDADVRDSDASVRSREYLLRKSLEFTFEYPVFGLGLGRFADFEGGKARESGGVGSWHGTHCSWTQISSEGGIPALIFYLASMYFAFRPLYDRFRDARALKDDALARVMFCLLLSAAMYFVSITFLTNALRSQGTFLIAIAIAAQLAIPARRVEARVVGT